MSKLTIVDPTRRPRKNHLARIKKAHEGPPISPTEAQIDYATRILAWYRAGGVKIEEYRSMWDLKGIMEIFLDDYAPYFNAQNRGASVQ